MLNLKLTHTLEEIREIFEKKKEAMPGITEEQFLIVFLAIESHYRHEVANIQQINNMFREVNKKMKEELDKLKVA